MKNSTSVIKVAFYLLALILMPLQLYTAVPAGQGSMPMAGPGYGPMPGDMQGGMPPLTEAELLEWQKEVDKEINAFVSTLPATRAEAEALSAQTGEKVISQEEFHQEVAIMEEKMKNMATYDEQNGTNTLGEFLTTIFPQEDMAPQAPVQAPVIEQPVVTVPETPAKVDTEKAENTEKVANILNSIITRAERFLRKATTVPEFAGSVVTWAKQDKIKEWKNDLTWATLKAHMESFIQLVRHVKDSKDPKTGKSRYLTMIMKDESLLNNLSKINNSLTLYEPKFDTSALGTTKSQETATLNAAKDVLGVFCEVLYTLELPQELKKLIEKYEPQAKILREESDVATKRALEESKRPTPPLPRKEAQSIGYGASPAVGAQDSYGSYAPYYGGYNPTALPEYNPNYDYGPYPYDTAPAKNQGAAGGASAAQGHAPKAGPAGAKAAQGEATSKAEGTKDAAGTIKQADNKKAEEPIVPDPVLMKMVDKFTKSIDSTAASIEDHEELLTKFDAHITATSKVDPAFVTGITSSRGILKSLRKATDALIELKGKLLRADKNKRDYYFNQVKLQLKDASKLFEKVAQQLQKAIEHKPEEIPANKLYAYFGQASLKDAAVKIDPALAGTEYATNIIAELLKAFGKFKDTVKGL